MPGTGACWPSGGLGHSVYQRPLRELMPVNIPWGRELSDGPKSWTKVSHLGGLGLTPYCSTKTSQPYSIEDKASRLMVKAH